MRGRPNSDTKQEQVNNNLEADLDTMQDFIDKYQACAEDETREAGEGSEMLFYGEDEL